MTDYVLTADFFNQIVERRPDRSALRIVKHRKGAILSDLTDAEVERLTSTGAIRPVPFAVDEDQDADPGDDQGNDSDSGDGSDEEPSADDQEAEPESVATASTGRPLKTATVTEWREYAVSKGLPKAEAAALTRAELISRYGGN